MQATGHDNEMSRPGARSVDCRADVAAPITWMGAAHAADPYPAKRIAIVVPQAPGGAGGNVGTAHVARLDSGSPRTATRCW